MNFKFVNSWSIIFFTTLKRLLKMVALSIICHHRVPAPVEGNEMFTVFIVEKHFSNIYQTYQLYRCKTSDLLRVQNEAQYKGKTFSSATKVVVLSILWGHCTSLRQ